MRRLAPYRDQTLLSAAELDRRLQLGLQEFLHASQESEFADRPLGVRLYHSFHDLLQRPLAPEAWPTVQAAALYLLERQDEEDDIDSPLGFEDDAEVFNEVCVALGHADLKVAP